jgi:hypothetical protein
MTLFAVQYLEDSPEVAEIAPNEAQARLRAAFQSLPLSYVLLGWKLPGALFDACAEETARAGARLYRWHPLLTGDGTFTPRREWRYQGVFLDRIRYPSPALDPSRTLACFCEDCRRAAREEGLDLEDVRRRVRSLLATPKGARDLIDALLGHPAGDPRDMGVEALRAFLRFRASSVSRFVRAVSEAIRGEGLEVGLDCFSPALTWMVGQDLQALDAHCEWIKIMSYGHAMGPAGLPFELLGLVNWLVERYEVSEARALGWLSAASGLGLPSTREALHDRGLTPQALGSEVRRARAAGVRTLLAGIELVELEGIARPDRAQVTADLRAFRSAGADGLVLSWDLWHIRPERLEWVRQAWV